MFEELGTGRTLLILGEPGSGKTVTLLKITQSLIQRTENALSQPLPVVMNLSSWSKKQYGIAEWVVQELCESPYYVSQSLARTWVEQQQLILLLDGLDEVDIEYREKCVRYLNKFVQEHGLIELIVCSRIRDYEALSVRLRLQSAIYIQPLTLQQVNRFLKQAGEPLANLRTVLNENQELQTLAASPLILSIMSLAYQNCAKEAVVRSGNPQVQIAHLFNTYVERMFQRRNAVKEYSREETLRWLVWLAQQMVRQSQSIFLIEDMQPVLLTKPSQRKLYRTLSVLGIGLLLGLAGGSIHGIDAAISHPGEADLWHRLSDGLWEMLIIGLSSGSILGLIVGLYPETIQTVETLRFSERGLQQALIQGIKIGIFCGIVGGLIYGFLVGLVWGWGPAAGLLDGFLTGLIFGIALGLTSKLKGPEIEQTFIPNQGIWRSLRNTIISVVIGGLLGTCLGGLIYGLVIYELLGQLIGSLSYFKFASLLREVAYGGVIGLAGGILGGFIGGGGPACVKHLMLRLILWRNRCIPWNYARFLDYASDRLFLQKVGGGYIFIHRMLLEHFAQMKR
ncbi:MAG: NACHT domain-containing protein [Leptolyngbya sp. SIO4C5]|nr:NACHT domain-containing protein [Leptolyngbya sp. SIO4C5]